MFQPVWFLTAKELNEPIPEEKQGVRGASDSPPSRAALSQTKRPDPS